MLGLFGMPDMLTVTEDCQRPILMGGGAMVGIWAAARAAKDSNSGRKAGERRRSFMWDSSERDSDDEEGYSTRVV